MIKQSDKRGQATIFVILAIIVVGVVLMFFLFPQTNVFLTTSDVNPSSFLRKCIEPSAEEILGTISKQGGYANPENYVLYMGEKIQYLCYTNENYETCKVQEPLLRKHIEDEVKQYVQPRAGACMQDLKKEYEKRGYNVDVTSGDVEVSFVPGSVNVEFLSPMTISKESSQTFSKFAVSVESEMYGLIMTATNIIQFESTLGDSETTLYLQFYPDLKIEKIKKDGDTIYKLSNVVSGESFAFASRSLVWPQGYGLEEL